MSFYGGRGTVKVEGRLGTTSFMILQHNNSLIFISFHTILNRFTLYHIISYVISYHFTFPSIITDRVLLRFIISCHIIPLHFSIYSHRQWTQQTICTLFSFSLFSVVQIACVWSHMGTWGQSTPLARNAYAVLCVQIGVSFFPLDPTRLGPEGLLVGCQWKMT